jgi:hypothetical protein
VVFVRFPFNPAPATPVQEASAGPKLYPYVWATVPAPVVARDTVAVVSRPAPSYPNVFADVAAAGPDQAVARVRPARDRVRVSVWVPAGVVHVCPVTRPPGSRPVTVIDAVLPG